ncbi:amidohydrolase family protein [Streptosporangium sp. NPDC006930]|uniref:amidohydrolase family protein n=1 Tax=unclassified Streptosporangium TaxID=2632669 RepID=UPI00342D9467
MKRDVSRRSVIAGAAVTAVGALVGGGRTAQASTGAVGGAAGKVTAVVRVTVIDATGRPAARDMTVLVRGERIVAVGPVRSVPVPAGATVVDGTGKFLIPGLVDMHVHSTELERTYPPLYLANGVTTVREMSANPAISSWRREVEAGTRLGPRYVIGSRMIDGAPSLWEGIGPPFVSVAGPEQARAAVRQEKAAGADFIKTYTRLSRASFLALADEARRQRIPILGHVPDFVRFTEASDAGLRTIEHLSAVWYNTSDQERKLRQAIAAVPIGPGEYAGWYNRMHPVEYAAARSYDRRKAARVFDRLARNQTRLTPTLTNHRVVDTPSSVRTDDPRHRYFPAQIRQLWEMTMREVYLKDRPAEQAASRRELFERRLRLVAELDRAGVPLLAGTDTGTSYVMPGFGLHDELELLSQAGLSGMSILRAATLEPARQLGLRDHGTVERGKVADMVLLDADPLRDIRNTTRINAVFVRGRLIDRAQRQRMLDDVITAAREPVPAAARVAGCACHPSASHALHH